MGILARVIGNAGVVEPDVLNEKVGMLLVEGENIEVGFRVIRDMYIFTNKRFIYANKQGITGKKIEFLSILYDKITRFSVETAGHFDLDAELKIWVAGMELPIIDQRFSKKVNIYDLQRILATHVIGDINTL